MRRKWFLESIYIQDVWNSTCNCPTHQFIFSMKKYEKLKCFAILCNFMLGQASPLMTTELVEIYRILGSRSKASVAMAALWSNPMTSERAGNGSLGTGARNDVKMQPEDIDSI